MDIRNGLSHVKVKDNLYISDRLLDQFFDDIKECVDAVKQHQQTLKADEIKDTLEQVWLKLKFYKNIYIIFWTSDTGLQSLSLETDIRMKERFLVWKAYSEG